MSSDYPRGLTKHVYRAVKALMIAEGVDLGETPNTLEWLSVPDMLSAVEGMLEEEVDFVFEPAFLVDRERRGTVGVLVTGTVNGELFPQLRFFIGEGDPPLARRILPEQRVANVDSEWLSQLVSKEDADELRTSALELIATVRREVGVGVSTELAPTLVMGNQNVRSGVIRFSVVADMVARAASVAHIANERWNGMGL